MTAAIIFGVFLLMLVDYSCVAKSQKSDDDLQEEWIREWKRTGKRQ